jgi:hypothetical protein
MVGRQSRSRVDAPMRARVAEVYILDASEGYCCALHQSDCALIQPLQSTSCCRSCGSYRVEERASARAPHTEPVYGRAGEASSLGIDGHWETPNLQARSLYVSLHQLS